MNKNVEGDNIVTICENCAPKAGQFTGQSPDTFVGKLVKLAFAAKRDDGSDTKEHMWVRVQRIEAGDYLQGILLNTPVLETGFSHGDDVGFHINEIEEVREDHSHTEPIEN